MNLAEKKKGKKDRVWLACMCSICGHQHLSKRQIDALLMYRHSPLSGVAMSFSERCKLFQLSANISRSENQGEQTVGSNRLKLLLGQISNTRSSATLTGGPCSPVTVRRHTACYSFISVTKPIWWPAGRSFQGEPVPGMQPLFFFNLKQHRRHSPISRRMGRLKHSFRFCTSQC